MTPKIHSILNSYDEDVLKTRQIRAARALLDWSQEDLAAAAELSIATIRKIESGHISPRGKTMHALRHALENAGLEFLEPDGVRHRPDDITVYQGRAGFRDFFDDVYETVRANKCDIVVVCPDEAPVTEALEEYIHTHRPRMTRLKDEIDFKCIVTENKAAIPAIDYCEYRWMSKHYVDSVPFYVYGDKYAIVVFETNGAPKVTVLRSPVVASAFKKMFYSMLDKATPLNTLERNAKPVAKKQGSNK